MICTAHQGKPILMRASNRELISKFLHLLNYCVSRFREKKEILILHCMEKRTGESKTGHFPTKNLGPYSRRMSN